MHIPTPIIVWLDSNSIDPSSRFRIKLNDHQDVQMFNDVHPCIAFIKSHSEQTIFLIVSGTFALQIVPEIYELSNVLMIFIFCASMKTYTEWAIDFCDKLMMFDHEDDLLLGLWSQIEVHLREQAKEYIKRADQCKERAKQLQQTCG